MSGTLATWEPAMATKMSRVRVKRRMNGSPYSREFREESLLNCEFY
jgi:hypothetical protein